MPIDVIGTTQASAWIPQIWAQEMLAALRNNVVLANLVNRDYDGQVANMGNTVNVPIPPVLTARDAPLADTTANNVTGTTTPVTLNKFKTVDVSVGDVAQAQSAPDIMRNIVRSAAIALAETIENDLFALYTNATTNVGTGAVDVTPATVVAARKNLVTNKVPALAGKYLVLSPKDYAAILGNSAINAALNYGSASAIQQGKVPSLYGFELYESQLVPYVVGTPNTYYNLALARDSMVLVTRPLPAPMATVQSAVISDPDSKLSFRMTLGYDQNGKSHRLSFDILYGVAALRPSFMVQVKG
ncbi:MAG TPA: P22 phage major capsid protein family protein [Deinococcales bacterium]|nr:P22 phage major capsid protein family protein [Deinococcales bacterium]